VKIREVNWESGQWGRFLVHGKGANGSGPRALSASPAPCVRHA
jgi:integrase/recombinase XerC